LQRKSLVGAILVIACDDGDDDNVGRAMDVMGRGDVGVGVNVGRATYVVRGGNAGGGDNVGRGVAVAQ
jgi:hypothetical protein